MTCNVRGCDRDRARDAQVCLDHLNDLWANRLERQGDGTFVLVGLLLPSWRRRIVDPEGQGATLGLNGKDLTGWVAAA